MKSLTKKTVKHENKQKSTKSTAQCCAKISKNVAGCHD